MKFSEMPYKRPDPEAVKAELREETARLRNAKSYGEARAVFLENNEKAKAVQTASSLVYIRQSIDTRDEFYNGEKEFWDDFFPELEEYEQEWLDAMLSSPFRKDFGDEFGDLMFVNAEIQRKTFSPEIIEDMQKENELTNEYDTLIASAQIPFEGGVYTLSQLAPFRTDADDSKRLAAWKADGKWYKEHQEQLDRIYDDLVKLRDGMGRKLGYGGYTELGYYRMERNCYTKEDIEKFRAAVIKYLVPVADSVMREQAKRLGKEYPLSFADAALEFRSGNPRPVAVSGQTFCKFAGGDGVSDSEHSSFGDAVAGGTFDVEDLAMGFIRFENGAVLQIEFSWASNVERERRFVELMGTKAGFAIEDAKMKIFAEENGQLLDVVPPGEQKDFGHERNLKNFVDVLLDGAEPCYKPQQGVDMIAILDAFYRSAAEGREIRL